MPSLRLLRFASPIDVTDLLRDVPFTAALA
jgi:hypothetical protein